jgi:hypothetical protein
VIDKNQAFMLAIIRCLKYITPQTMDSVQHKSEVDSKGS